MSLEQITSPTLSPHCMQCMLDKYLDACPEDVSWQERADYMRFVLRTVADGSVAQTAPEITHTLTEALSDRYGIRRDFASIKRHFNDLVLGLEPELTDRLSKSDDPLDLAIRCALVGNFIDFGPTGDVSEERLLELVDQAPAMDLDEGALSDLKDRIRGARTITILSDNCGEVVLDKLLIAEIAKANPQAIAGYARLEEGAAKGKALDPKTRELIALAVAATTRCDGCISVHAAKAKELGCTKEEIADALGVALAMNAGAALVYSSRILEAFDQAPGK